jgi:hypothetical protein
LVTTDFGEGFLTRELRLQFFLAVGPSDKQLPEKSHPVSQSEGQSRSQPYPHFILSLQPLHW